MEQVNISSNKKAQLKPKKNIFASIRNRHFIVMDILIILISYIVSVFLVYNKNVVFDTIIRGQVTILLSLFTFIAVLMIYGIYTVMWIHAGTKDYLRLIRACIVSDVVLAIIDIFVLKQISIKVELFMLVISNALFLSLRMAVRGLYDLYSCESKSKNQKRLLIIGAGNAAAIMLKDLTRNKKLNYNVVGFVDDDENKKNASINGVRILGNRHSIRRIVAEKKVDEILIAIPSAPALERKRIIEICNETKCKVKILPSIDQSIDSN